MWVLLGGNGFVGKHLQNSFLQKQVPFRAVTRSEGDFRKAIPPKCLEGADAVLLLAGITRSDSDESLICDNLLIVRSLIEAYKQLQCKAPLFFLSSLHVYPLHQKTSPERTLTAPPRSLSGWVKASCESLLTFYSAKLGFPLWIGRAANLISLTPPINPLSFVYDMRQSLVNDGKITVRFSASRDIVLMENFAEGLLERLKNRPWKNQLLIEDVSTGSPLSLHEIALAAKKIWESKGKKAVVLNLDPEPQDIMTGTPLAGAPWGKPPSAEQAAKLIAGEA